MLTPDQANPYQYGLSQAIQSRYTASKAAEQEAKNPYVGRQSLADALYREVQAKYLPQEKEAALAYQGLINQYYGRDKESEIGLRGATAHHYQEEDATSRYKREHDLLKPENIQLAERLGILNPNGGGFAVNNSNRQNLQMPAQQPQVINVQSPQAEKQTVISAYSPADPQQQMMQQVASRMGLMGNKGMNNQFTSMEQNPVQPFGYAPSEQDLHQAVAQRMQPPAMAQQTPSSGENEMVPGTNIPISVAREAFAKKVLGIPTATIPDPSLIEYRKKSIELAEKREKAAAFRALPQDARDADAAVVAPMVGGYTNAARELMNGRTPEEIAESKGYDPKDRATWPAPTPPPGKVLLNQIQKTNVARNARESIHQRITDNLGFYPSKIKSYSPQMIADLVQGKNVEQAGKSLAAAMMVTEDNALLARGMGAQAGLGLLKMMGEKSLSDLKVPAILQSKELLDSFRKEIRNYSNIMIGNENNTLNEIYRLKNPAARTKDEATDTTADPLGIR